MENTFENALNYVHHLDQIDDGWSESERTLASAFMSYAAKTVKNLTIPVVGEQLAITALTKIAHPIKYLQDEAIKEGAKLDGCAAITLTHDINFYQDIAIKALREIANSL